MYPSVEIFYPGKVFWAKFLSDTVLNKGFILDTAYIQIVSIGNKHFFRRVRDKIADRKREVLFDDVLLADADTNVTFSHPGMLEQPLLAEYLPSGQAVTYSFW